MSKLDRSYRTWRLALAFFGGFAGAILILDALFMQARADAEGYRHPGIRIIWWPLVHLLVLTGIAYWPAVEKILGNRSLSGKQLARISLAAALCVYAAAAWISSASSAGTNYPSG